MCISYFVMDLVTRINIFNQCEKKKHPPPKKMGTSSGKSMRTTPGIVLKDESVPNRAACLKYSPLSNSDSSGLELGKRVDYQTGPTSEQLTSSNGQCQNPTNRELFSCFPQKRPISESGKNYFVCIQEKKGLQAARKLAQCQQSLFYFQIKTEYQSVTIEEGSCVHPPILCRFGLLNNKIRHRTGQKSTADGQRGDSQLLKWGTNDSSKLHRFC